MIVTRIPAPPGTTGEELVFYTPETDGDVAELERMYADGRLQESSRMADGRAKVKATPADEGL